MIAGIVLAAGRSSRIGRPKALLRVEPNGITFLQAIVNSLRAGGIERIAVVVGGHAAEIEAAMADIGGGVVVARNPVYERGQLSSLLAGLDALDAPDVDGVLVTLIDMPLVSAASVRALLDAASREPRPPVVRATYKGEHGHPVVFNREVFSELRTADETIGAKQVVRAHARTVVDLEVNDPGVVIDIDTPDDYQRFIARRDVPAGT